MKKISQNTWPEIVFSSSDSAESQAIHRAVKVGVLRKIAPRVYTSNFHDAIEKIILRHHWLIVSTLFPGAVISHRTALEMRPSKNNLVLTYKYNKKITLPGLTIRFIKGLGPQKGDTAFLKNLYFASQARALLENLQPSRKKDNFEKTVSHQEIEALLDKICRVYGIKELNILRDKAKVLAEKLKMKKEFKALDDLIGAFQGTKNKKHLKSPVARARARGLPYDPVRLVLFADLAAHIKKSILPIIDEKRVSKESLKNLAFFEAYFSNYIEGTEFEISEASEIIFHHKIIFGRAEDSHDILGTFEIVSNTQEISCVPDCPERLIQLLQHRHKKLLSVREDKHPGKFKLKTNRVGNTVFVEPELVRGTIEEAFKLYESLAPGLPRACFMMFLVSEIHPFTDGNGRLARIMMNAELVHEKQVRIIVPTVYREDYLLALRRLSRSHDPDPYLRMLLRAQLFTSRIDFSQYIKALHQLEKCHAFDLPQDAKLKINPL
ncbi:MAG: hypothetical protein ACD_44C00360G0011 [uncultured bacterium]|nr:MAG: hypothetical protein ACD_44C00360G0011 [uncultured bacterium]OGT17072.1 MAG: hypothetical protein A3B69_05725 [Gammaproteobacteria bacterium RIFCSPHIGHO2_02_FULL_38_33]OGT68413.1 MAG: hypothetical protein A3I12_07620 [Gammaproteobacteria bacterium RIFCSPLOWO2_02_FULL_38_11]OGT77437.1 MAG: hypothetical protein A3G71_01170 [Gammaproteobacteria bacterium RIFCSPLOWO2_12_FULL_38_14]